MYAKTSNRKPATVSVDLTGAPCAYSIRPALRSDPRVACDCRDCSEAFVAAGRQHARLERRLAERIDSIQAGLAEDPYQNGEPWCAYLDGPEPTPYDCPCPGCAEYQPYH